MTSFHHDPSLIEGRPSRRCPACAGENLDARGAVPQSVHFCTFQYDHAVNRSDLVECATCNLLFKTPCLTPEQLGRLYAAQPDDVWGGDAGVRPDFAAIASYLSQVSLGDAPNILDVGCFTGDLLLHLRDSGAVPSEARLFGVEPSVKAAAKAEEAGIEIVAAAAEQLPAVDRSFDVVTMVDVFEHVLASLPLIEGVAARLAPGGRLIIGSGAADSDAARRYGSRYYYVAMPEHVAFISKRHAQWLAARTGLVLEHYDFISHAQGEGRLKGNVRNLAARILGMLPTRLFATHNPFLQKLAKVRGSGMHPVAAAADHALVVLRKPEHA